MLASSSHDDIQDSVVTLLSRAESHIETAGSVHPLVAGAYRRRAAELRLAAWVGALRTGPVTVDTILAAGSTDARVLDIAAA